MNNSGLHLPNKRAKDGARATRDCMLVRWRACACVFLLLFDCFNCTSIRGYGFLYRITEGGLLIEGVAREHHGRAKEADTSAKPAMELQ